MGQRRDENKQCSINHEAIFPFRKLDIIPQQATIQPETHDARHINYAITLAISVFVFSALGS